MRLIELEFPCDCRAPPLARREDRQRLAASLEPFRPASPDVPGSATIPLMRGARPRLGGRKRSNSSGAPLGSTPAAAWLG